MHVYLVTGQKPRQIAARVLLARARRAEFVESLLEAELARATVPPADRALAQELTFGVVRWQATLDWLIVRYTNNRPQTPALQTLLRLGFYQKFWLERIPNHALVATTVELARHFGAGRQTGFVNAVLRRALREADAIRRELAELQQTSPGTGFSHPQWLCDRWQARWGDASLRRLLAWNNSPPPTYARLNTLRTDPERLARLWADEHVTFVPRHYEWTPMEPMFELASHPPLATLPSFQQGAFYVQDPSTLLAVHTLNPQPGESVLDLCAAPGGKTTAIAQRMRDTGRVEAEDVELDRRRLIRANCERLGITCVRLAEPRPAAPGDAPPLFDRVLLDAPCSNTGVMRRRVEVRWRIRPGEMERLSRAQFGLLARAATRLRPGGTLVYSTCSLEPEENAHVIRRFLADHAAFELRHEQTLLPFEHGVDGAYVAQLVRGRPHV
ncbi:MAG: 16S rRNA (cytosine(967)-C(5))-methyltransferase RsmB [Verrucomicrobia bacterium]|nr:16S rRNA (cytosine(967)-C(5))-methyltransferase RsmB [Verrucomicrobiota bacterium]